MYIIAIGWLYIVVLMAISETNWVAGILTLTFYGLFPLSIVLWLFGGPVRRRRQALEASATETAPVAHAAVLADLPASTADNAEKSAFANEQAGEQNRQNPQANQ